MRSAFSGAGVAIAAAKAHSTGFMDTLPGAAACGLQVFGRRNSGLQPVGLALALRMLPLQSEWSGRGRGAGLLLTSPAGRLTTFDPLCSGSSSPNIWITGGPASGKTMLVSELMSNYLARGCSVRHFGVGSIYAGVVRALGGKIVQVDPDAPMGLNIFGGLATEEAFQAEESLLLDVLTQMVLHWEGELRVHRLDDLRIVLNRAMRRAWQQHQASLSPSLIADALCEHGAEDREVAFAEALRHFLALAPGWFNECPAAASDNPLVAFDFEPMRQKAFLQLPVIRDALSVLVMREIANRAAPRSGARRTPTLFLLDEAHWLYELPAGTTPTYQVEAMARETRKLGCSLCVVATSIADPLPAPLKTARGLFSTHLILRQHGWDEANVAAANISHPGVLAPLVRSLDGRHGYSEFVLVHEGLPSLQRIHYDGLSRQVLLSAL